MERNKGLHFSAERERGGLVVGSTEQSAHATPTPGWPIARQGLNFYKTDPSFPTRQCCDGDGCIRSSITAFKWRKVPTKARLTHLSWSGNKAFPESPSNIIWALRPTSVPSLDNKDIVVLPLYPSFLWHFVCFLLWAHTLAVPVPSVLSDISHPLDLFNPE